MAVFFSGCSASTRQAVNVVDRALRKAIDEEQCWSLGPDSPVAVSSLHSLCPVLPIVSALAFLHGSAPLDQSKRKIAGSVSTERDPLPVST